MPNAPHRDDIRRAFAETVRTLRQKAGIQQERLAWESGVDRGYYGGLERGEHTPTLETLYKLLPLLGVSFTEFAAEFERTLRQIRRPSRRKPEPPEPII